jgi:hypothetical protein
MTLVATAADQGEMEVVRGLASFGGDGNAWTSRDSWGQATVPGAARVFERIGPECRRTAAHVRPGVTFEELEASPETTEGMALPDGDVIMMGMSR